jgi:hypothetical protein
LDKPSAGEHESARHPDQLQWRGDKFSNLEQNLVHARSLQPARSRSIPQIAGGPAVFELRCGMANSPAKKKAKAVLLGVGLDSDGHKRVTTGPNFALIGGSEQTHEVMTEKVIKINEKLAKKGKTLEEVTRDEMDDIAAEVGLHRNRPERN